MSGSPHSVVEQEMLKLRLDERTHVAVEEAVQSCSKNSVSVSTVGRAIGVVDARGTNVLVSPRDGGALVRVSARSTGRVMLGVAAVPALGALAALVAYAFFTPVAVAAAVAASLGVLAVMLALAGFAGHVRARRRNRKVMAAIRARVELEPEVSEPLVDEQSATPEAAALERRSRRA